MITTTKERAVPAKRVNIVSVRLVRESSVMYEPRYVNSPQDAAKLVGQFLTKYY